MHPRIQDGTPHLLSAGSSDAENVPGFVVFSESGSRKERTSVNSRIIAPIHRHSLLLFLFPAKHRPRRENGRRKDVFLSHSLFPPFRSTHCSRTCEGAAVTCSVFLVVVAVVVLQLCSRMFPCGPPVSSPRTSTAPKLACEHAL